MISAAMDTSTAAMAPHAQVATGRSAVAPSGLGHGLLIRIRQRLRGPRLPCVLCPFRQAARGELRRGPVQGIPAGSGYLPVPGRRSGRRPGPGGPRRPGQPGTLSREPGPPGRPSGGARRGLHGPAVEDLPLVGAGLRGAVHPDRVDNVDVRHRRPRHPVITQRVGHRDPGGIGDDTGPPGTRVDDCADRDDQHGGDSCSMIAALHGQVGQGDDGDNKPRPRQHHRPGAAEHLPLAVRVLP